MNALLRLPKYTLVGFFLLLAIVVAYFADPLRDQCDVQVDAFRKNSRDIFFAKKINSHISYPKINFFKSKCVEANSEGGCEEYFSILFKISQSLKEVHQECAEKLVELDIDLASVLSSGIKIMALVAWGEAPPKVLSSKIGWLNSMQIKTFCSLKSSYQAIYGYDSLLRLRNLVYAEYPDEWPEGLSSEERLSSPRPRALKSGNNLLGHYSLQEVNEKSLFSIACDSYL